MKHLVLHYLTFYIGYVKLVNKKVFLHLEPETFITNQTFIKKIAHVLTSEKTADFKKSIKFYK